MIDRYLQRGRDERAREIVTPEGVPLPLTLGAAGDRAGAFVLDVVFMFGALFVLALILADGGIWAETLMLVLVFVLRSFYFVIFETRWQGLTPGKRIIGIRVIDARGGQLDAGAILARNLMRELEVWMPLTFLFAHDQMWPGAPGWAIALAGIWVFIAAFMPLFNKDRLRIGDMVAGTKVVVQPRTVLLPDLADTRAAPPPAVFGLGPQPTGPMFAFTDAQLDVYGIYELQVLEGVLRGDNATAAHHEAIAAVTSKIYAKIGYTTYLPPHLYERFLRDFYTALRAHLEKKMLFGKRREDKFSR